MKTKSKPADSIDVEKARRQFAADLAMMKHRAGQLRLYATMHQMDYPLLTVGYEIAGDMKGLESYRKARSMP